MLVFKVVETSDVTDVTLETIVNEWVKLGWNFDGFHFAMRDSSRRPAMAFIMFSKHESEH